MLSIPEVRREEIGTSLEQSDTVLPQVGPHEWPRLPIIIINDAYAPGRFLPLAGEWWPARHPLRVCGWSVIIPVSLLGTLGDETSFWGPR